MDSTEDNGLREGGKEVDADDDEDMGSGTGAEGGVEEVEQERDGCCVEARAGKRGRGVAECSEERSLQSLRVRPRRADDDEGAGGAVRRGGSNMRGRA